MIPIQEKKLNDDIKIIVDEVLKTSNCNITSIILYGSYGRGEGAFYEDKQGDIRTYNDYDLILVVDKNKIIKQEIINQISDKLEEKLDVKWIDISQKTKEELKTLTLTIFNFDLKYGSTVIYGDKAVLEYVPDYDGTKLPLKEAETLFFTRIWAFMGGVPIDGFEKQLSKKELRFFRNQMAKAILATVDVILLQKGKYNTSYKKRVQIINDLYDKNASIVKWSNWAIEEKCSPKAVLFTNDEIKQMYLDIAIIYSEEMYAVLSKFYKRKIKSAFDIEKSLLFSVSELVLMLKSIIKSRSLIYLKKKKVKLAQAYLLDMVIKGDIENIKNINKVKRLIEKTNTSFQVEKLNWHDLRLLVSKLRVDI